MDDPASATSPDGVPGEGIPAAVAWATSAMGALLGVAAFWVLVGQDQVALAGPNRTETARSAVAASDTRLDRPRPIAPPATQPPPTQGAVVEARLTASSAGVMNLDPVVVPPGLTAGCLALRFVYPPNASRPDRADRERLARLGRLLHIEGPDRVLVQAYTDTQGDPTTNLALSDRRAQWVRAALADAGLDRGLITAQGFGQYVPLPGMAPGDPRNRRIDVRVLGARCPSARELTR